MIPEYAGKKTNTIKFRFVTQSRWITGHINTIQRRLLDVLNSDTSGLLMAEDVSSRFYPDVHSQPEVAPFANINVGNVLFAIPLNDDENVLPRDPFVWVRKKPQSVDIEIGPYGLSGSMFSLEDFPVRDTFSTMTARFIALTGATVTRTDDLTFNEQFGIVVFSRDRLEIISQKR